MKKYLAFAWALFFAVVLFAVAAEAKSLKDVEKAMKASSVFASANSSWYSMTKDLSKSKKDLAAIGYKDSLSFAGDDTKGFMQEIRIAEFKGKASKGIAKKFWDIMVANNVAPDTYGEPVTIVKAKSVIYYFKGSVPDDALKALQGML